MLVKWKFGFDSDHLVIEVRDQAADDQLSLLLKEAQGWLLLPTNGHQVYLNLNRVRMIIREEVNEDLLPDIEAPND